MATAKQLGTDDPETLQKIIRHCDADCERLRAANPTPFDIATACLYWTKYPLLVAIIGDDRRTSERYEAYNFLSRAHRHAAKLLCAVADRKGIDGGAIYSAGEICRELFRWAPNTHRDGHFPYAWPDCLGLSRKALPEHDQQIIRAGSAAYTRLVAHLRIQFPPKPPAHGLDKSLGAILDDVDAKILAIEGKPVRVLFHGDGLYSRGNEFARLDGAEAYVLQALVERRAATKDDLARKSGVNNAPNILRRIKKKYPILAEAIGLPGARGRGGYTTSITLADDQNPI